MPFTQIIWKDPSRPVRERQARKGGCKILPCDKAGRCGCWGGLTGRGNWAHHSWAKVQLWEELTCDTNTMNTIYILSLDQFNQSRHWCNYTVTVVLLKVGACTLKKTVGKWNKWADVTGGKDGNKTASSAPYLNSTVSSCISLFKLVVTNILMHLGKLQQFFHTIVV